MKTRLGLSIIELGVVGAIVGILLSPWGCNRVLNNRNIKSPGKQTISYASGIIGHKEYTKYEDGSADLKVYPDIIGHRYASSKLYEDLNGDGLVDKIRINGPEFLMHRLNKILVRKYDYQSNQSEFDKADKELNKSYKNISDKLK